ncbi:MAG: pitrilysin family protein [Rhodothermales bacterium]
MMSELTPAVPLAERVTQHHIGEMLLQTLPTPVRDVVAVRGSFRAHPDFGADEDLVQTLCVKMLDKGTVQHDQFAIADVLENRGAKVSFRTDGDRVVFHAKMLNSDVGVVLPLLAEQIHQPRFAEAEFQQVQAQVAAELQHAMQSTGAQAGAAFSKRLYSPAHPNYDPDPAAQLDHLAQISLDDVRAFHVEHFGANELVVTAVGDLDEEALVTLLAKGFGTWPLHKQPASFTPDAQPQPPGRSDVPIADKMNLDVLLGHAIRLRRQDPDYLALYLANFILGGNFSSRLMGTIRDEQGLTYGINSGLSGIGIEHDADWRVKVTLSQANLEHGIEAVRAEVARFLNDGVTQEELDTAKTTVAGIFQVSQGTTGGLASLLHTNAERQFDVAYLDRFTEEVHATTLDDMHAAMARHLSLDSLQVAVAGTLPD